MLLQGSAFEIPLADKSVHCVATSPPYWGLRKYAGEQGEEPLGLEAMPERHIERMVLIMREVRRVLRDDGVVWFNYGDCYYNHRPGKGSGLTKQTLAKNDREQPVDYSPRRANKLEIESGSLMLMPHRVAIALQDDGWIVRNDVIWHKPNPMPESVAGWRWERERQEQKRIKGGGAQNSNAGSFTAMSGGQDKVGWEYGDDYVLRKSSWRHTRSHEYVFQLVKSMGYWSNQEAVREAAQFTGSGGVSAPDYEERKWAERSDGLSRPPMTMRDRNYSGRNPRSVLNVPTAPYKGSHYATFPPNLIAPLIRASCPRWACPECGQGWAPVVEREPTGQTQKMADGWDTGPGSHGTFHRGGREAGERGKSVLASSVKGYRPTCEHEHTKEEAVPGIVFDPFVGSGTTVMVANELLRRGVGLDLSRPYLDDQARIRTNMGGGKSTEGLPLFQEYSGEQ